MSLGQSFHVTALLCNKLCRVFSQPHSALRAGSLQWSQLGCRGR